jgi:hypothetical protein
MGTTVERDEQVAADQDAMTQARADAEREAAESDERPPTPAWSDLKAEDVVEMYVHDEERAWHWEPREVVAVETVDDRLLVRLRDPETGEESVVDAKREAGRPVRWPEVEPDGQVEEPDGQQALRTDDPITLTTTVHGPRPKKAQVKIAAYKEPVDHDLDPGDSRLYVGAAVVTHVDGLGSDVRVHNAEFTDLVHLPDKVGADGDMSPGDAISALFDLQRLPRVRRAVIDHAVKVATELVDEAGAVLELDLAVEMRRRLFEMYSIAADPVEATHGTSDHEEAAGVESPGTAGDAPVEDPGAPAPESEQPAMVH